MDCEAAPGMSIGVTRECVGTFQTVAEQKIEEGSKQGGMAANSSISRVWLELTKARTLACSSIAMKGCFLALMSLLSSWALQKGLQCC